MCTAIAFHGKEFYFGRTLDHARSYGEEIVLAPRNFPLPFREAEDLPRHPAIMGMAHVEKGYPLFYDAMNEAGLCMAGLNFTGFARYGHPGRDRIAPFEFLPWVLGRCEKLDDAKMLLQSLCLTQTDFSDALPCARLHWIIADRSGALTVESTGDGLHIYDNPVGVLTNDPTFPHQLKLLDREVDLPGDLSSPSRFRRAAFTKTHAKTEGTVSDFFHILDPVTQVPGCNGEMFTRYTSCCSPGEGRYYYTTYENRRISALDMRREDLSGNALLRYSLLTRENIRHLN